MAPPRIPMTLSGSSAARLVALSHDLMCALDLEGRIAWANPSWRRVLGWDPAELAGRPYHEMLHPEDRERAAAAATALASGAPAWPDTDVRLVASDGSYRWMLFNAVFAREDKLVYLSGKDVSERTEAAAETSVLHARYRALVSNLPDTVVTLFDSDLRILVAEGMQLTRRGLDSARFEGRLMAETMPASLYAALEPRYRAALAGEPQAFDLDTADGAVTYAVQAVPLYDEEGRLLGGLSVARDVTERRRHEGEQADRAAELERSNAELAQFAYVASHDLSEPLRMVSSYLQLLRRRYHGQIDDDADAFIDYAIEGANRMRALIEDLLAFSRSGRAEREPEPVDLGAVVAEVAATLAAKDPVPRIEWSDLPVVHGDPGRLKQLFQNLIGNGVKFVADGVTPWVRVDAEADAGAWRFTVSDNGVGISPEDAEKVFGMFQRLHSRDEFEGTGIGLAICRKVVQLHGGEIRAVPLPEGGTRFEFTLTGMQP
jgi:PAS domain S-box-containing protein